ncbi:MAG: hypothetical protein A2445_00025 [Candidatus Jacksonbacteria bacterium RIFOXYC2_FULL_44_29]|nr:MAG: hypothetical protein A2295_01525 [Candidatus Jacksonbacteria bacterium RIFOXYB2_FULL_44_15]OGY80232.1 MAG: hypothetical protein A2445_00025 [Candidatus Jacksonbacteria bacterium RIFOXYC2_FULL_44_29]OGY82154.1 MAG: hypothetical protein A2550_03000 [Candidatus Jacksonbacteria bacterium RIFOXYD2_FULL_43_21]HBH46765.1 hypothetical protein [Candidatus Jacksonbacteria bacterium]HCC49892.1 hypothetical protein [Candidatus Jacksonbacteria bacterium]
MPLQYSVPQFVDVENKVIGPISVRQFVIIAAEIGIIFCLYKFTDFTMFLFGTIITVAVAILFAFIKVNGRPFHYFMLNFLMSVKNPHLRVWKKVEIPPPLEIKGDPMGKGKTAVGEELTSFTYIKMAREKEKVHSRLSDLSLLVDTGGFFEKH